ncbi:MAG: FliA/WhiG family RNA polymerase sigma factor [Proteobacteria bacterium]|nr:FliA/WhiG family RNA polymerase sigma factor [Pseudomonadota bacterium]MBU1640942.1 FliA/WhiG family RNA polymerase sigma factor [Pseudomonadota bacterium]
MIKQQPSKFKDYTNAYFQADTAPDAEKRDELILAYTPLIKYIASRLASRLPAQVAFDDLVSSGIIGLIDAIDKFDIAKNVQFKTYAEFRIRGAMLDELRSLDWVPRSVRRKATDLEHAYNKLEKKLGRPAQDEETALEMAISLDDFYKLLDETKAITFMDIELLRQQTPDQIHAGNGLATISMDANDPFAAINLKQIRDLLASSIEALPEKERLVVSLYYFNELTMKEIGQVLNYTESRISQMHSKAMLRLRTKIKKALAI